MSSDQGPADLKRMYRIFKFIQLLSAPPYYKVVDLAQRLDVSKKTVYNYINLLEEVGFQLDKNEHDQYFLSMDRRQRHEDELDVEQASYLQDMLWQMADKDPRRNQILRWINKQYSLGPVIETMTRYTPSEHRSKLTTALENKRRVKLMNYRSANGKVSNRYVEPVGFQQDYTYIYTFDLDRKEYRQFHLSRVGYIDILSEQIEQEHSHHLPDIFGWTGPTWKHILLELNPRAHQLLIEEYPGAKPNLTKISNECFQADFRIRGYPGIGRWCLGLCGDVRVLDDGDGKEFREYLNDKWAEGF